MAFPRYYEHQNSSTTHPYFLCWFLSRGVVFYVSSLRCSSPILINNLYDISLIASIVFLCCFSDYFYYDYIFFILIHLAVDYIIVLVISLIPLTYAGSLLLIYHCVVTRGSLVINYWCFYSYLRRLQASVILVQL